ncbi:MAG: hypothetical protein K2K81_10075 [Muribaculaceae bacterium]|nr:hypothetical protein [Muribaculaceae bacterium]
MKKYLLFLLALIGINASVIADDANTSDSIPVRIYDSVIFYDGYRMKDNPDSLLNDGTLRHSCSLYSRRLTEEQLDALGEKLDLNVYVEACCDNYDRIGNINIAFVGKGAESYVPEETERIEIGRFITPFMNKNREPKVVPYNYQINYLSGLLRDQDLRAKYDLWLEFELFGVPYAANKQVKGCADRSDVFAGTLEFVTNQPAGATQGNVLVPIVMKKPEYIGSNLNNYKEEATDTIGKTVKTYTFNVPETVADAQLVLITSNHGANDGGEEYNRRKHFVYVDGELILTYIPGRTSCEPFRKYNTQTNFIYGYSAMTDREWQSFSNWCPGDVIDNRIISLGAYEAGNHEVMITVPDAKFVGKQGDIPVSLYFHGLKDGKFESGIKDVTVSAAPLSIDKNGAYLMIGSEKDVVSVEVYTIDADMVHRQWNRNPIDVSSFSGVHVVCVEFADGSMVSKKIML